MKTIKLLLLCTIVSLNTWGQDSLWKQIKFNNILCYKIPANFCDTRSTFMKFRDGDLNGIFYRQLYFDTIFLPIETEKLFEITVMGYMSGAISDLKLKKYDVIVLDTSFGGTKGLMAKFTLKDSSETFRQIGYYFTIANNHYYQFNAYSPYIDDSKDVNFFFNAIKFDYDNLKEKDFKLTPFHFVRDGN